MEYIPVILIAFAILVREHWRFMNVHERFQVIDLFDNVLWKVFRRRPTHGLSGYFWYRWMELWCDYYIKNNQ